MIKWTIALATLALGAFGGQQFDGRARLQHHLKEESITLEYTVAKDEAVVKVQAESESYLEHIEVLGPNGLCLATIQAGQGRAIALSGFVVETREGSLGSLRETYREGIYDIQARTIDGYPALGNAMLSHDLLAEPVVTRPRQGAMGVPTNPKVEWIPDPQASAYKVILEQGENDGLVVQLSGDTSSFEVPRGVLESGTETWLEIAAIGANGNSTLVELSFTTQ